MKLRVLAACAVLLLAAAGPALAQSKDPADLMPAGTLAYLELRHPDKLAKEVNSLLKGSALEDMAATMAKAREKRGDNPERFFGGPDLAGMIGAMLSPEMMAEFGRLQGGAVALTGWNKDGPEIVGIILNGESNYPPIAIKAYLAMDPDMRIAGEVEGVKIYRARRRDYNFPPNAPPGTAPPSAVVKDTGPTFAVLPGMVVITSSPESAKDVVRRVRGKSADPALSSVTAFKQSAKLRDRPGLFAYADLPAVASRLDEEAASPTASGSMKADWAVAKAILNPKAIGTAVMSLSLQNGDLEFRAQVQYDGKQSSPLLDLLPDTKVALDGLHFAPKNGLLSVTMPLGDGEKRWKKFVEMLDAVAAVSGAEKPSKDIDLAEQKLTLNLGKDVFAKMSSLTLTVDLQGERMEPRLGLAVTGKDADAAKALEDALPKLIGLGSREETPVAPTEEKVKGVTLKSFGAPLLPNRQPLYYVREGSTLVLGQSKDTVADALLAGTKKQGLLGDPKVAAALKDVGDANAVGVISVGQGLSDLLRATTMGSRMTPRPGGPPSLPGAGGGAPPGGAAKEEAPDKYVKELLKASEPLPPMVLTLTRTKENVVLEVRQTGLKSASAKIVNALVEAALHEMYQGGRGGGPGAIQDDLPIPPPIIEKP